MLHGLISSVIVGNKIPTSTLMGISNAIEYAQAPGRFVLMVIISYALAVYYQTWEMAAEEVFLLIMLCVPLFILLGRIFFGAYAMVAFICAIFWYGPTSDFAGYYAYHTVNTAKEVWHKSWGHDPNEIISRSDFDLFISPGLTISEAINTNDNFRDIEKFRTFANTLRYVYPDSESYYSHISAFDLSIYHIGQEVRLFRMCSSENLRLQYEECQGTGGEKLITTMSVKQMMIFIQTILNRNGYPISRWKLVKA